MSKRISLLSEAQAIATAEVLYKQFDQYFNAIDSYKTEAATLETRIQFYIENTNITQFMYPHSLLRRMLVLLHNILNPIENESLQEETHYTDGDLVLSVLSNDYYGTVDGVYDIMVRNSVYSTDEAIKKGIVKLKIFGN